VQLKSGSPFPRFKEKAASLIENKGVMERASGQLVAFLFIEIDGSDATSKHKGVA
jgi:hypothetical protein